MTINKFQYNYRFLSNFFPCKLTYEGIEYPTAEHAFQAAKTDNTEIKRLISIIETPKDAKAYGRLITPVADWGIIRVNKMREILKIKFAITGFRDSLLRTGDHELIEGNNWGDKFWGQCNGEGSNWLGKILMEIREEIKNDQMPPM